MTRRRIVFTEQETGDIYTTPEFNSDKADFKNILPGSRDSCDKEWHEILNEFKDIKTLKEFRQANEKAQSFYHSFLGDERLSVERIRAISEISADEVIILGQPDFRKE